MRNFCLLLFLVGAILTSAKKRYDGWVPFYIQCPLYLKWFTFSKTRIHPAMWCTKCIFCSRYQLLEVIPKNYDHARLLHELEADAMVRQMTWNNVSLSPSRNCMPENCMAYKVWWTIIHLLNYQENCTKFLNENKPSIINVKWSKQQASQRLVQLVLIGQDLIPLVSMSHPLFNIYCDLMCHAVSFFTFLCYIYWDKILCSLK